MQRQMVPSDAWNLFEGIDIYQNILAAQEMDHTSSVFITDHALPPTATSDPPNPYLDQIVQLYETHKNDRLDRWDCWHFEWDTRLSHFSKDDLHMEYAQLSATKKKKDTIRVRIGYRCNNSFKISEICKSVSTMADGIRWIWGFIHQHSLCKECGSLLKTDEICESCLFFKGYMSFMGKKEVCAICQDPVYRCALPCGHMFHRLCINKMEFSPDIRCPLCRSDIPFDVICNLFDKSIDHHDDDDEDDEHSDTDYSSGSEQDDHHH